MPVPATYTDLRAELTTGPRPNGFDDTHDVSADFTTALAKAANSGTPDATMPLGPKSGAAIPWLYVKRDTGTAAYVTKNVLQVKEVKWPAKPVGIAWDSGVMGRIPGTSGTTNAIHTMLGGNGNSALAQDLVITVGATGHGTGYAADRIFINLDGGPGTWGYTKASGACFMQLSDADIQYLDIMDLHIRANDDVDLSTTPPGKPRDYAQLVPGIGWRTKGGSPFVRLFRVSGDGHPYGYGLTGMQNGHHCEFHDVFCEGGVAVRLEANGGDVHDIIIRNVYGRYGKCAVNYSCHDFTLYNVDAKEVWGESCETDINIRTSGTGKFGLRNQQGGVVAGTEVVTDGAHLSQGNKAQIQTNNQGTSFWFVPGTTLDAVKGIGTKGTITKNAEATGFSWGVNGPPAGITAVGSITFPNPPGPGGGNAGPPSVLITAPGATATSTAQTVTATISDPDGVASAESKVNARSYGPMTDNGDGTWSRAVTLVGSPGGTANTISVRATDAHSSPLTSTPAAPDSIITCTVTVTGVNAGPPIVAITGPPTTGTSVNQTVTATASDPDGVDTVECELNLSGTWVAMTLSGSVWSLPVTLNGSTGGTANTVKVRATDGHPSPQTSTPVSRTVTITTPPVNAGPPSVAILAPPGTVIGSSQKMTVSASDPDGIALVEASVNGGSYTALTSNGDGTWSGTVTLTTSRTGTSNTLAARATDAHSSPQTSTPVTLTVTATQNPETPTQTITSPAATVSSAAQTAIATATDPDGIASQECRVTAPYPGGPVGPWTLMVPTGGANNEAALPVALDKPAPGASSVSRISYRSTDAHPTDPQKSAVQTLDVTVSIPASPLNTTKPVVTLVGPATVGTPTPTLEYNSYDPDGTSIVQWRQPGQSWASAVLKTGYVLTDPNTRWLVTPTLPIGTSPVEVRAIDDF